MKIEDIEQIYYNANSKELYDYIVSLKPEEDNDRWRIYSYKGFVIFYNNINSVYAFYPLENPNNTLDWIHLNSKYAVIMPQHLLSRYRKRILDAVQDEEGNKPLKRNFDIRKNLIDSLLIAWYITRGMNIHLAFNIPISDKYNDSMFGWCEDGLIPIEPLSNIVYKCITFIPTDMLRKEQWEIWKAIYKTLVENKVLDKDHIQIF